MSNPRTLALLALVVVSLTSASVDVSPVRAAVPSLDMSTASIQFRNYWVVSPALGALRGPDTVISVTLLDATGQPVANYPRQDVWAQSPNGEVLLACDGSPGFLSLTDSDANGQLDLNGNVSGTGFVSNGLQVYVGGAPLTQAPLSLEVTSPDMDLDFDVDLVDVGIFAEAFFHSPAGFDPRADFISDGIINTADLGELAVHYGETCP